MELDRYKDIFGKPREGVHRFRIPIVDWALVDVVLIVLLTIIFYMLGYKRIFLIFIILFFVGQLFHYMFGVQTAFIKQMTYLLN